MPHSGPDIPAWQLVHEYPRIPMTKYPEFALQPATLNKHDRAGPRTSPVAVFLYLLESLSAITCQLLMSNGQRHRKRPWPRMPTKEYPGLRRRCYASWHN